MTSPFITFRDKDINGYLQYYILQKEFPHFLGRIVYAPVEGALANAAISGYNMWVTFNYTLRGHFVPSYKNMAEEISTVYNSMAIWFYTERIIMDKSRFKKFKINKDEVSISE